ncbi:MAG: ATPase, T2SS/T4P/T4SS family, partial [Nitrospinota bacterium]
TGHLVLSTLHTIDAGQTINRILGMADNEEEKQIRLRLADSLRWVVCQRLLPKNGGGRVAAFEIMSTSLRIKDLILNGESEDNDFYKIIEDGEVYGMITFDKSIADLYKKGLITEDIALAYASRRAVVGRFIDQIKSSKGEKTTDIDGLQIDEAYGDAIKYKKGTK